MTTVYTYPKKYKTQMGTKTYKNSVNYVPKPRPVLSDETLDKILTFYLECGTFHGTHVKLLESGTMVSEYRIKKVIGK